MKKILFTFALLVGFYNSLWAYDFSAVSPSGQTLYYTVLTSNTVYLTYPNDTASLWTTTWNGYTKPVGNVVIPDSVLSGGQWYHVTNIGNGAFAYCTAISSITLPSNLRVIGRCAFLRCSALGTINLENSNVTNIRRNAFENCVSLGKINFPATLSIIDTSLFLGCTGLHVVTIPENIRQIGPCAFRNAYNIDTVYFNSDSCVMSHFAYYTFDNSTVAGSAYLNISGLFATNIIYGDNVEYIEGLDGCGDFVGTHNGFYVFFYSEYDSPGSPYRNITFGRSVGYIYAMDCGGIQSVTFRGNTPPYISLLYPTNTNFSFPCTVPCGTITQYRTRFPYFTNFIEGEGYSFAASSDNNNMGTVQILTMPTCTAPNAVLYASANNGYRFDHWSTGSTSNPYSLTVTSDTVITAYFVSDGGTEGIGDVDGSTIHVYTDGGNIIVNGAEGEKVKVFDMVGRPVGTQSLPTGVYMVKVGTLPARKVAVIR